jgi:hypothetical protein
MRREAVIGLMALIAILTLAVSSVDLSLAAEEAKVEHLGFKNLVLNITELERTNGDVTAILFNVSLSIDNPNPETIIGDIEYDVKEKETKTFLSKKIRVELLPNESSVISIEEKITDEAVITQLTKGNLTLIVFWEIHTYTKDEGFSWTGAESIEIYNEGSGVWSIPISVTPPPIFQQISIEEIKSPENVNFKSIEIKITELERTNGEVTAVLFNMSISIDNPNPVKVYETIDFRAILEKMGSRKTFLAESDIIELLPNESSVITIEEEITDKEIVEHLTGECPIRISVSWDKKIYATGEEWTHQDIWGFGGEGIVVYKESGSWPPPTSVSAEEPGYECINITDIVLKVTELEITRDGEVTAVLFNMNVSIDNPNTVAVFGEIYFDVKEMDSKIFLEEGVCTEFLPNESSLISIEKEINALRNGRISLDDKFIIDHLTKENPIIVVQWEKQTWVPYVSDDGLTTYTSGPGEKGSQSIGVHSGLGVWPPPASVRVVEVIQSVVGDIQELVVRAPEAIHERPETIFAIAGLIVVTYMLIQPKKKNLKIRTAASLGLLCIVLNILGLGIFNPFYFIFVVSAILTYSCLFIKQKWSATLVMFVYSMIGAAIMVFFYLLFDVTSEWDYLHLARFAANAFYLLPAEGIGGFIITILFGVSIGIIADVIYAISKGADAYAAVFIGLAIGFFIFVIFIGMASSGPGGLEGPVFILVFPMIIFGALGGYLGYFFLSKTGKY